MNKTFIFSGQFFFPTKKNHENTKLVQAIGSSLSESQKLSIKQLRAKPNILSELPVVIDEISTDEPVEDSEPE